MPKLLRSIYAGGYTDEKKRRLHSVKLPPRIKCAVCHKLKAVNFFSTIQQLELQNGIATGQVGDAMIEEWIPCVSCTPKQVTELECCICEEVKDLAGFAKAQRRLGENARCITCVAMLNGDNPIDGSFTDHLIDELGKDDDGYNSDDSTSNIYETSTLSETESSAGVDLSSSSDYDLDKLSSLSISSNDNTSKPLTSASATATKRVRVVKGASEWQNFAKENKGQHIGSSKGAEFTGFDRDGNAHRMFRPASTVASDDDDSDSTIADPKERARLMKEERTARSRFAKLPSGRDVPVVVPTYVGGKTVPNYKNDYDDDDDGEDDWGTI